MNVVKSRVITGLWIRHRERLAEILPKPAHELADDETADLPPRDDVLRS